MHMRTNQETNAFNPEFDPYTDPVRYLMALGIEAELVEPGKADLPSAA